MSDNAETAILAGGCFWGVQELLRHRDGVISTRVGYAGGGSDNPTDEDPGEPGEKRVQPSAAPGSVCPRLKTRSPLAPRTGCPDFSVGTPS